MGFVELRLEINLEIVKSFHVPYSILLLHNLIREYANMKHLHRVKLNFGFMFFSKSLLFAVSPTPPLLALVNSTSNFHSLITLVPGL